MKVLAIGIAVVDLLAGFKRFPKPDEKIRFDTEWNQQSPARVQ